MDIFGYSAHVLVNGRKVKEYRHNGLTFIEAKDGTEFAIEVKNHQGGRVLAIVSVDGLDIIDGKPATAKSRGYIIDGYNSETLHGYRKNENQVANFKFTCGGNSYATDKGKGENNGIIAVKFIGEAIAYAKQLVPSPFPNTPPRLPTYPKPYYYNAGDFKGGNVYGGSAPCSDTVFYESAPRGASASAGLSFRACSDVAPAAFDMGTTWGSVREERVTETEFKYGAELGTCEFYYASREALQSMGIPLISQKSVSTLPKAFADSKYASPPKGWKG